MEGTVIVWLSAFFLLVALLILVIYQFRLMELSAFSSLGKRVISDHLMCLADLEFDYINPYDSSSRINTVILPEFVLQGILCLLFLVSGHWMMFLFAAPMLYYNVRLYQRRKHLLDITEIFSQLNDEKKRRLIKLIYLVTLLFLSLFWMIWSVLEDD